MPEDVFFPRHDADGYIAVPGYRDFCRMVVPFMIRRFAIDGNIQQLKFRHFRCVQKKLSVDAQHTLHTAYVGIPLFVHQPCIREIFVLYGSVRFSEKYKLLFFDEVGEKHIVNAYPYFAFLVAQYLINFGFLRQGRSG